MAGPPSARDNRPACAANRATLSRSGLKSRPGLAESGLSHGFGAFNAKYDGLAALDGWVESGTAPGPLTAVDGNPGAGRTRPMCLYPTWPRYNGTGSVDEAASFTCAKP